MDQYINNTKLEKANSELVEFCKRHNVNFSVTEGQIVLIDSVDLESEVVIDTRCHL